jgi:hypothetical protein
VSATCEHISEAAHLRLVPIKESRTVGQTHEQSFDGSTPGGSTISTATGAELAHWWDGLEPDEIRLTNTANGQEALLRIRTDGIHWGDSASGHISIPWTTVRRVDIGRARFRSAGRRRSAVGFGPIGMALVAATIVSNRRAAQITVQTVVTIATSDEEYQFATSASQSVVEGVFGQTMEQLRTGHSVPKLTVRPAKRTVAGWVGFSFLVVVIATSSFLGFLDSNYHKWAAGWRTAVLLAIALVGLWVLVAAASYLLPPPAWSSRLRTAYGNRSSSRFANPRLRTPLLAAAMAASEWGIKEVPRQLDWHIGWRVAAIIVLALAIFRCALAILVVASDGRFGKTAISCAWLVLPTGTCGYLIWLYCFDATFRIQTWYWNWIAFGVLAAIALRLALSLFAITTTRSFRRLHFGTNSLHPMGAWAAIVGAGVAAFAVVEAIMGGFDVRGMRRHDLYLALTLFLIAVAFLLNLRKIAIPEAD